MVLPGPPNNRIPRIAIEVLASASRGKPSLKDSCLFHYKLTFYLFSVEQIEDQVLSIHTVLVRPFPTLISADVSFNTLLPRSAS